MAAAKTWRRLKGENQLPKLLAGVRFQDGTEVAEPRIDPRRPDHPRHPGFQHSSGASVTPLQKVLGRKRHVLVDTLGLLLNVDVHPRQACRIAMACRPCSERPRKRFPFIFKPGIHPTPSTHCEYWNNPRPRPGEADPLLPDVHFGIYGGG